MSEENKDGGCGYWNCGDKSRAVRPRGVRAGQSPVSAGMFVPHSYCSLTTGLISLMPYKRGALLFYVEGK